MHDQRDDGKDQQQMNEEAADMQDEKSTQPKHYQYNRQYDEHEIPSFVSTDSRGGREYLQEVRGKP
jgi:hypothetical protein